MNEPCQAQVSDLSDNDLEQLSSGKGSRNNVSLSSNQAAPTTSAVQPVVVKGARLAHC